MNSAKKGKVTVYVRVCGGVWVFLGSCVVRKEKRMQGKKKSECKLFWFCTKKVIAEIYSSGIGIRSTLWSKKMSEATVDSFLIVFTGGLGSEEDRSGRFS